MAEEKTHQEKPGILFVCTAGGARSIFASAFANQWAKDPDWAIASGFESCRFGEPVNRLFEEIGLPEYRRSPKTVFQRFSDGESFDFLITMCGESKADVCQSFRKSVSAIYGSRSEIIDWDIPDFRGIQSTGEAWLAEAREIRDEIRRLTEGFISHILATDGQARP